MCVRVCVCACVCVRGGSLNDCDQAACARITMRFAQLYAHFRVGEFVCVLMIEFAYLFGRARMPADR